MKSFALEFFSSSSAARFVNLAVSLPHYQFASHRSDGWPQPPLRYAVQGFAALRRRESKWAGEKELQEGIGKSAGEWHFTLGER